MRKLFLPSILITVSLMIILFACKKESPSTNQTPTSKVKPKFRLLNDTDNYDVYFGDSVVARYTYTGVIGGANRYNVVWEDKFGNNYVPFMRCELSMPVVSGDTMVRARYLSSTNGTTYSQYSDGMVEKEATSGGDCDELGGRRTSESFDDCFVRNWSNFCCDFESCVAQAAFPLIIAAACSLSCADAMPVQNGNIETVYNVSQSTVVYVRP